MTITPERQAKGLWITIGLAGAALLILVVSLIARPSSGALPASSAPNNQGTATGAAEPWPTGQQAPDSETEMPSSLPESTGHLTGVPPTVPETAAGSPGAPTSKDTRPSKIAPMSTSVAADGQTYYLYPIGPNEADASSAANQPTDAATEAAAAPTKSEQQAMDTASRWVAALCTWDYRKAWNSNVTAASPLSVGGKPEQIPLWQIAKTDWPAITAQKLTSSCSGVTARVDHGNQSAVGPTKLVVVVNAEQTTTQGGQGTASKQPIEEVRILSLTQLGWRVGPPTAAA